MQIIMGVTCKCIVMNYNYLDKSDWFDVIKFSLKSGKSALTSKGLLMAKDIFRMLLKSRWRNLQGNGDWMTVVGDFESLRSKTAHM